MRNLKKVLSLALALVMLLGMMVIGAGAAYSDADAITKTEAVDVMTAIGIFEGSNGVFNPQGNLLREQAAKILVYVSAGPAVAKNLGQGATKFTDVSASHWASGYVAYCSNLGIIAGMSADRFEPRGELTAAQFAKMLLVAMGGNSADYEGDAFFANTPRDAIKAGLNENVGVTNWNAPLTREQACQMALNALTKTLDGGKVHYPVTTPNGTMYFDTANEAALYAAVLKDATLGEAVADTTGTLGERNYGLKQEPDEDELGYPATKWTANGDVELVIASTAPTLSIAGEDFDWAKMVKDGYKCEGAKVWYNGSVVTSPSADEYFTNLNGGYGATIDLYCDGKTVTKAVVTEPYFAVVTTAVAKEGDSVTLAVYEAGYVRTNSKAGTVTITKDDEDYDLVKDLAKGDVFMGVFQSGWDTKINNVRDGKLVTIAGEPEAIQGKVTAMKMKPQSNGQTVYTGSTVTVDGTVYKFSSEYSRQTVAVTDEGTFYLYNGYVYHYEAPEDEGPSTDYALIVRAGVSVNAGSWQSGSTKKVEAVVVLSDGTTGTYQLAVKNNEVTGTGVSIKDISASQDLTTLKNKVYAYTIKDDVMTLSALDATQGKDKVTQADSKYADGDVGATSVTLGSTTALFNSKTVFVTYTVNKDNELTVGGVYTGPTALGKVTYATTGTDNNGKGIAVMTGVDDSKATVNVVFVNGTRGDVTTDNYVYVIAGYEEVIAEDGETVVRAYNAYDLAGEQVTVYQNKKDGDTDIAVVSAEKPLYAISSDNYIGATAVEADAATNGVIAAASVEIVGDQIKVGTSKWYNMTDDTVTVIVADGAELESGCKAAVVLTKAGGSDVATIFVTAAKGAANPAA